MKCNQSRPGFELVSSCPFLTTITITQQASPKNTIILHSSLRRNYSEIFGTTTKTSQSLNENLTLISSLHNCEKGELCYRNLFTKNKYPQRSKNCEGGITPFPKKSGEQEFPRSTEKLRKNLILMFRGSLVYCS